MDSREDEKVKRKDFAMNGTEQALPESVQLTAVKPRTNSAYSVKEPWLKRPLDILLSTTMLILSAPVCLPIALAIKLEDRGPVFYLQERLGESGEDPLPITIHRLADYTD